jgi:hypothetical protein
MTADPPNTCWTVNWLPMFFSARLLPSPVQAAHGEISPFPADQFFKVQSEFETDVVAIGKAGAFSSDRVSGEIA